MSNKPLNGFDKRPQDINRSGRPKGPSILDHIKEILQEDGIETGTVKARDVARIVIDAAIEAKDLTQCRDLIDRLDGKSLQTIVVSNEKDTEWLEAFKSIGQSKSKADGDSKPDATESTQDTDT